MNQRSKLTDEEKSTINLLKKQGMSLRKIAKTIGKPKSTVSDYYREFKKTLPSSHGSETHGAKILLFDIETAPMIGYIWGRWKQNIASSQMLQESYMLTWAAKWLGSDTVMSDSVHLHHDNTGVPCDKEVVQSLWQLVNEADFLIYQNGDRFDLPRLNTRAIMHGLPPVCPSKTIDTLKIAKYNFAFSSNRLDDLAVQLGLPIRKIKTDFGLWAGCMQGSKESFEEMLEYNVMDVDVLEQVYLKLRPYDRKHPNLSLFAPAEDQEAGTMCGTCGSKEVVPTGQYTVTPVSKFEIHRCGNCGATRRDRVSVIKKAARQNILTNIAR